MTTESVYLKIDRNKINQTRQALKMEQHNLLRHNYGIQSSCTKKNRSEKIKNLGKKTKIEEMEVS